METYVVDTTFYAPAMWSRYAKPVLVPSLEGTQLVDALKTLQQSLGVRPLLFNTHELAVSTISQCRSALATSFLFRVPEHSRILDLQDKARFQHLATELALPVPRGLVLRDPTCLRGVRNLRFPVVVKPVDKRSVHTGKLPGVRVLATPAEAIDTCQRLIESGEGLLVQEWVDGAEDEIYFCLFYTGRGGSVIAMFTGRKLASNTGNRTTAYCMGAPDANPVLESYDPVSYRDGWFCRVWEC